MLLTQRMVQGVDVWINNPRRPWEACGTSGMKVLVNGGLNISELDGWWAEAYSPDVGWVIGDDKEEYINESSKDILDAQNLYNILEQDTIPTFYRRNEEGLPFGWVAKMRASMARLTPRFSANRAVVDYTEKYYLPAARELCQRVAEKGKKGTSIMNWKHVLEQNWFKIRFERVRSELEENHYQWEVVVYMDGLDPSALKLEIYADACGELQAIAQEMLLVRQLSEADRSYVYRAVVPADRPEKNYTARILPFFPGVAVPLEENRILWQS